MTIRPSSPALIPQTVIAVRESAGSPWRMLPLRCEPAGLSEQIAKLGLAGAEKRFVGTSHCAKDRWDDFFIEKALRCGWHQGRQGDAWYPIEEPLSLDAEPSTRGNVVLSLKSIMWGKIAVAIEATGEHQEVYFDDMHDELVVFARFVHVLAIGGQPHAALADYAMSHFAVRNGPQPDLCHLHMKISQNDGEHHRHINVLTEREKLVEQFRSLASAIACHPNLGHHFLCHCCLPEEEYGRVNEAARSEWERGVREGRFPDDYDAEQDFRASKLVAGLQLPAECAKLAEEYGTMLRTLEIPGEWLVRYGLAAMGEQVPGSP